jgi:lipoyl(octanoyl) transferase
VSGPDHLDQQQLEPARQTPGHWPPVQWAVSDGLTAYVPAVRYMEQRIAEIAAGTAPELIWLLEHPPLYTAGTSAKSADLLTADRFPVHLTGRGGQYTYHGPGQRVIYVMLNVKTRSGGDVRRFVSLLETWVIATLARFNVRGRVHADRVGVWVERPPARASTHVSAGHDPCEDKIAAIGIRLRQWVSMHGIAINVEPDLEHFSGIVPCGLSQYGVTSLADLGLTAGLTDVDMALQATFRQLVAPTIAARPPIPALTAD